LFFPVAPRGRLATQETVTPAGVVDTLAAVTAEVAGRGRWNTNNVCFS